MDVKNQIKQTKKTKKARDTPGLNGRVLSVTGNLGMRGSRRVQLNSEFFGCLLLLLLLLFSLRGEKEDPNTTRKDMHVHIQCDKMMFHK